MTGRELYEKLRSVWQSPNHSSWEKFVEGWDESSGCEFFLGKYRREVWDECAALISTQHPSSVLELCPSCGVDGALDFEIFEHDSDNKVNVCESCWDAAETVQ